MNITIAVKSDYKEIKKLYNSAFPKDERAPFRMIKRRAMQKKAQMLVAKNDGQFMGFAYVVNSDKAAYFFYFAVREDLRGKGVGTKILSLIKEMYADKILFLAREQIDETADNYDVRVKRRSFYMRNGFTDVPRTIREATVVYDVMTVGGDIDREEYLLLMKSWGGDKVLKLVDMQDKN